MPESTAPLKIVSLTAENVKRLRAVTITPDGNLVVIGGRNAQGKTSVLDSIAMAIGGAGLMPKKPIRDGATHAEIILDLGEFTVTRKFTASGPSLIVKNAEGATLKSPQGILDALTSKVSFDPLAFLKMDGAQQFETMRRLVGIDFTALDQERGVAYAERTGVNREVSTQQIRVNTMKKHDDAPKELVDSHALLKAVEEAEAQNKQNDETKRVAGEVDGRVDRARVALKAAEDALAAAKEELDDALGSKTQLAEKVAALEYRDVAALRATLADADANNQKLRDNAAHAEETKKLKELAEKARKLTRAIEDADEKKAKAIKGAKFPIEGLSFDDTGVLYDGQPFAQASNAEQLRVSVAVGAAMNPRLKVLLVRDGSLLDEDNLKLLATFAQEHDCQVFLERVGKGKECSVIIEDGEVEEQPAPAATE